VDTAVVGWVTDHVLSEELLLDVLREVRRRLADRAVSTTAQTPQLEKEAAGLRAEIGRIVTAIASTDNPPAPLVSALSERQERLDALDARLRAVKAAPAAIELEVRRMEAEAKKRIADMRNALARNPEEARKVLEVVLDGPLRVSPVDLPEGRRFQIDGAAAVGRLLAVDGKNPDSASPAGFEPA
jgi:septal ring factor EnvC (AmiA/AmiB activator)